MSAVEVVFVLASVVAVASAVMVVSTDHMVHAALWLVVTLGAVAGCFLLMTAEFVAWVQVLIYVGAIVVLLLFGLMLTQAPTAPSAATSRNKPVAMVAGFATTGVLAAVMWAGFHTQRIPVGNSGQGSSEHVGTAVFTTWVLPFEVLSVVLLAALIGAIVLSRRSRALADQPAATARRSR
ncbi:MAG: NADH-quinone oxidoreductase subunit J family protein [Nocardioidaceae bacterium]